MKHFRTLGLCLMAALSLMAFVGATQASALFLENGATITSDLTGSAEIVGLEKEQTVKHGVLLVPAKELEILCTEVKVTDGLLLKETVLIKGILEFTNCKNFQKGKESAGCKPKEPITTSKILAHLILHETLTYALLEPETGTKFTTIDYNEETCALPDAEVKGTLVAEGLGENYELHATTKVDYLLQELVNHLITEASRTLFPKDILSYGANEAFIDGVLNVFLIDSKGAKTGAKFSGHV